MAVYSTDFYNGVGIGTVQTLYVVPVGFTVVIREMHVFQGDNVVHAFNVQINQARSAPQAVIWYNGDVPAATWLQWQGRVVVNQEGSIIFDPGTSSKWLIYVGGYLLTGTPPA